MGVPPSRAVIDPAHLGRALLRAGASSCGAQTRPIEEDYEIRWDKKLGAGVNGEVVYVGGAPRIAWLARLRYLGSVSFEGNGTKDYYVCNYHTGEGLKGNEEFIDLIIRNSNEKSDYRSGDVSTCRKISHSDSPNKLLYGFAVILYEEWREND